MDNYTVIEYDLEAIQSALIVQHAMDNISHIRDKYIQELEGLRKKYQDQLDKNLDLIKMAMNL